MSRPPDADEQPDEVSDKQKERDSTTTASAQVGSVATGNDTHSVLDQDKPLLPSESADSMSCGGFSDVNLCSQQLSAAGDEASAHKQTVDTAEEEKTDATEPSQKSLHPVQAAAQFATKPIEPQVTTEGAADAGETRVVEDKSKSQPEESLLPPPAECETQGDNQQEAGDQVETTKEKREAQISAEGGNECSEAGFNSNFKPKEDSLVEISFDDVPEARQIKEFREKQLEEETSQTNTMEMRTEERSDKVAAAASGYRMVGVEKEVSSEGGGTQHEAPVMTARVEANDCNLSAVGDKAGEGVASLSSSPRPCSEAKIEESVNDVTQPNKDTGENSADDDEDNDDDLEREEPNIPNTEEAETLNIIGQGEEDSKTAVHEEHNQEIGGNEDLEWDHQTNPDSEGAETLSSVGQGKEDKQTTNNEDPHQEIGDGDEEEEAEGGEEEEEEEEEAERARVLAEQEKLSLLKRHLLRARDPSWGRD